MEYLKTIVISFIISVLVVATLSGGIGATITQISGGDKLSDLDTLINTISSELNVAKMEVSTTTLPLLTTLVNQSTTGTLTIGTWNATVLTVTYGGTGLATLLANQVLLGNGTGNIAFVSGLGSSGQFLTSNGAGQDPTWQSATVNQTDSYNFTGTSFRVKNLHASSTSANPLILNGVSYNWLSDGTNGQFLSTDGSGTLSFSSVTSLISASTTSIADSVNATTTVYADTIDANIMGTDNVLRVKVFFDDWDRDTSTTFTLCATYGSTVVSCIVFATSNSDADLQGHLIFELMADNSTSAQKAFMELRLTDVQATGIYETDEDLYITASGSGSEDSTSSLELKIDAKNTNAAFDGYNVAYSYAELLSR